MARNPKRPSESQDPAPSEEHSPPTEAGASAIAEKTEKDIESVINRTFYNSPLFHFSKWVLLLSLGFVGLGSITIFGFNLDLAGRMMTVREQVEKVNKEARETIDKRSKELGDEVQVAKKEFAERTKAAADGLQATGKKAIEDFVDVLGTQLKTTTADGKGRIETLEGELAGNLKKRQSTLDSNIKAEQDRLDKLLARLNGLESNLSSILAAEAKLSAGTTTDQLQLIGAVLEKAAACLLLLLTLTLISAAISVYCLFRIRRIERRT